MGHNTNVLTQDRYGMCTTCHKKVLVGDLVIYHSYNK